MIQIRCFNVKLREVMIFFPQTGEREIHTPSHGAFPPSAFPCWRQEIVSIIYSIYKESMNNGWQLSVLPGSQVREHFDVESTGRLQLLFSHEQAVFKKYRDF